MKKLAFLSFFIIILALTIGLSSCGDVEFEVKFIVDGEVYESVTTKGNEKISIPENPSKEGYTFNGWNYDFTNPITENLEVEALWSSNTYTVNVDISDGKCGAVSGAGQYPYGTEITVYVAVNPGYTFNGWKNGAALLSEEEEYTFKLEGDINLLADCSANNDTAYKVEYYIENVTKTGYELAYEKTFEGTTNKNADAVIEEFEHFTFNEGYAENVLEGNIAGDGSLVLKVYYTRNTYTVTTSISDSNGGTVTSGNTYPYGTEITVSASLNLGYDFKGWTFGNEVLSENKAYTFKVSGDIDLIADVSMISQMKSFEFTSTATTCTITELKDLTLTSVIIPDCVTSIGSYAFAYCDSLASVVIPNSVTSISDCAFIGSYSLTIYCTAICPPSGWDSKWNCLFYHSYIQYNPVVWDCNNNDVADDGYIYTLVDGVRYRLKDEIAKVVKQPRNITTANIVTSINYNGIDYCVTGIEEHAFQYCNSLENLTIPPSVTSIGSKAFDGCYIEIATIPAMAISHIPKCKLKNVIINDGTSIDDSAFISCKSLESVVLPSSIICIGDSAFYACISLESITIPPNVISIGSNAFYGCLSLENMTIPSSVTNICAEAFKNCYNFKSITVDENNTAYKSIDGNLYSKDGKTLIQYASGKIQKSFEIPSNVTKICAYAFSYCHNLESVTIPSSVTTVEPAAVNISHNITIYCEAATQPSGWILASDASVVWDCKSNDIAADGYIYTFVDGIRYGIKDGYATVVRQPRNITVANIATSITYKDIVYSVTKIADNAFYGCDELKSLVIPSSVVNVGFLKITSYRGLVVYCEVASQPLEWASFWNSNLPVVWDCKNNDTADDGYIYTVVDGLRYKLKDGTATLISQSKDITTANIVSSITYKDVVYSVTSISNYAFFECWNLDSVTIPSSVTSIGKYAFYNCDNLKNITMPLNIASIGEYAFYGCIYLDGIIIPPNVTTIGKYAFANCYSFKKVIIPLAVTNMGNCVFYGCSRELELCCEAPSEPLNWMSDWCMVIFEENAGHGCKIKYNYRNK